MILETLENYKNPKTKLGRLVRDEKYIPIVRGLYETDVNTNGYLLAGAIYGPSCLSFEFALSFYSMIPERVYAYTSATFDKKKKKNYTNAFGHYSYRDVPKTVFTYENRLMQEGEYYYWIASPEKAICDKLYTLSPVSTIKEMKEVLLYDLRIYEDSLDQLNISVIEELAPLYHSTSVNTFCKTLRKFQNA